MTRLTTIVSAAFLILWSSVSAQQAPARDRVIAGHGALRGRVLTVDGQPLPRAKVHLEGERSSYSTVTNPDGDYEISDVVADPYRVSASLTGYITGEYGGGVDMSGVVVSVPANEIREHIDITLTFGAIVDGRVVDETGQPVSGAAVDALSSGTVRGQRLLTLAVGVRTNDLGRFRVSGLRPGAYVIRASPAADVADVGAGGNAYTPTYFPGVANPSQATPITVTTAGRVSAIDVALVIASPAAISGRLVRSNGTAAAGFEVVRTGRRFRVINSQLQTDVDHTTTAADGSFTFQNVRPGKYLLTNESIPDENARQNVVVGGSDIVGLQLMTRRAVSVYGAVVTDEGKLPPFPAESSRLGFVPPNAGSVVMLDEETIQELDDDWTFIVTVMGPVLLRPTPLPEGWDVVRVEIDGVDYTDRPFPALDKYEAQVRIVIARSGAGAVPSR